MPTDKQSLRIFTLALSAAMLIWLTLICYWQHYGFSEAAPFVIFISLFLVNGLLRPQSYTQLQHYWVKFAHCINRWLSRLLLCIIYLTVILPSALIYRLCGKHVAKVSNDNNESYLVASSDKLPTDMEQPF